MVCLSNFCQSCGEQFAVPNPNFCPTCGDQLNSPVGKRHECVDSEIQVSTYQLGVKFAEVIQFE